MADGSVPITAGSGTPIRAITNAGVQSGAFQQVFSLASPDGVIAPFDPDGTLQVSPEPTGLFVDDFSGTLTTNWTTGGTAPSSASGVLTTSNATTASATSFMRTIGAFTLRSGSYVLNADLVKLETAALTNNTRWWGVGINQTTPTAAAPVLNGAVWLLDYTNGALYAATYSAGTRTNFIALTRPSDGAYHRYEIRYRQSVIYFILDSTPVATIVQPNLAVAASFPAIIGSANFTTAPSAAPSLSVTSVGLSDLSGTVRTIGDGVNPWNQATVRVGNIASGTSDNSLVVTMHPASSAPSPVIATGTNNIGSIYIGSRTLNAFVLSPGANTTNATVVKASAGQLQELTLSNPTATAAFFKLYNKASAPTVGTDAPVLTVRLAASGSANDTVTLSFGPNGKYLTAGIAYAITANAAVADTTAAVAGIQVHGTYV